MLPFAQETPETGPEKIHIDDVTLHRSILRSVVICARKFKTEKQPMGRFHVILPHTLTVFLFKESLVNLKQKMLRRTPFTGKN